MSICSLPVRAVTGAVLLAALAITLPAQAATKGVLRAAGPGSPFGPAPGSFQNNLVALPDVVVDVTGISSFDGQGAVGNTVLSIDATPGSVVDAISWNVSLATNGASWLSEATILITNSAGAGVVFGPGFGEDFSGTGTYADSASLVALGLSFSVLADGKLSFEFYEDWDDVASTADAVYTAGTITLGGIGIAAVPEPGTYGLMGLGLLAVVGAARRRRAD